MLRQSSLTIEHRQTTKTFNAISAQVTDSSIKTTKQAGFNQLESACTQGLENFRVLRAVKRKEEKKCQSVQI